MGIAEKFSKFCKNLEFSNDEFKTINDRFLAISKRLNADFWNMPETTGGGKFVGSIGRKTANSWESDIDMLFEMPVAIYNQYNGYAYNGQSSLLQAVKTSISKTYPNTEVGGDGQIVKVLFTNNIHFEVLPAFKNASNTYTYPDSNNGGSWQITNPDAEINAVEVGDILTSNNLRNLCKMLRAWKNLYSVPVGGLLLDTFAYNFLTSWGSKNQSFLYYDYMTRDFFSYLKNTSPYTTTWYAIGSGTALSKKGDFISKAEKAYNWAIEAIQFEEKNDEQNANLKWKEIYGARFTT